MKGKQKKIIICGILLVLLVGAVIGIKSYQDKMKNRLWSSKWEDSFWNLNNENYMTDGILRQQDSYIRFCDNSTGKDDLICVDQNCSHEASKDSACGAYVYASQLQGIATAAVILCMLQIPRMIMESMHYMWRILRGKTGESLRI